MTWGMSNYERSLRFKVIQRIIEENGICLNTRNILEFEKLYDAGKIRDSEKVEALVAEIKEKYPEETEQ